MKKIDQCKLCGSTELKLKHECRDFLVSDEKFSILECPQCSACFTSPEPDQTSIGRDYESDEYIAHSGKSSGIIETLYKTVRFFALNSKLDLIQTESGLLKGSILDIGCGSGEFLEKCLKNGWDVTGLEPGKMAREKASDLLGKPVRKIEELFAWKNSTFDVITMWHVLEHVHEPIRYMKRIHELLAPGGIALIALPNHTSPDATHYGKDWAAWDVPRHLTHFSPQSMDILTQKTGFVVRKMKWMPFDSFYVSLLSETKVKDDGNSLLAILNGGVTWISSLRSNTLSSSIIYILKRNM